MKPIIDNPELAATVQEILDRTESLAAKMHRWPDEEREQFLAQLGKDELEHLLHDWRMWARPSQWPPGEGCECGCEGMWINWLILAGRGWGKTRTGAEWVHLQIDRGTYGLFHLVGATAADARDIMIEGVSGILGTQKPWNKCRYITTKRLIEWENGARALIFSADEPERLRGVQCEAAWCDELASWRYPQAWQQLQLGLRLGPYPRTIITTTPRPTDLVRKLIEAPTTHTTKGITYENLDNLAPAFIAEIVRVFEGTPFGRQEVYADIIDDSPGALFKRGDIDEFRALKDRVPEMVRTVVAVDPATSTTSESDETGIVVAGRSAAKEGFVLQDASGKLSPGQWAQRVVDLYHSWEANVIVAEANQGGDMVRHAIEAIDPGVKVVLVRATKGKLLRAEPVSVLYTRGLVHHVGVFPTLEDQMCRWEPGLGDSPDRLDALVYALTELLVGAAGPVVAMLGQNDLGAESYWKSVDRVGGGQVPWLSPP